MAESEFEVEPNYVGLSNLGSFNSEQITSHLECSVVEQSLSEVAALVSQILLSLEGFWVS